MAKRRAWLQECGGQGAAYILVEPYVENFKKFNSNTGKADNTSEMGPCTKFAIFENRI